MALVAGVVIEEVFVASSGRVSQELVALCSCGPSLGIGISVDSCEQCLTVGAVVCIRPHIGYVGIQVCTVCSGIVNEFLGCFCSKFPVLLGITIFRSEACTLGIYTGKKTHDGLFCHAGTVVLVWLYAENGKCFGEVFDNLFVEYLLACACGIEVYVACEGRTALEVQSDRPEV